MFWGNKTGKWDKMRERYINNKIDAQMFVNEMKDTVLYCSTPFGEDKHGKWCFYILSRKETEYKYYPAFLSIEHCKQCFDSLGRSAFVIIKSNLKGILSANDASPALSDLGVIIEPFTDCETVIPPNIRITK